MAGVTAWEERFILHYVSRGKRERYLHQLKGKKHRSKFLSELNHSFAFDPKWATVLSPGQRHHGSLLALLRGRYVYATCHLIANGNEVDGRECRLELGIDVLLSSPWGVILICPPVPIAIYKSEDPGQVVLLERRMT